MGEFGQKMGVGVIQEGKGIIQEGSKGTWANRREVKKGVFAGVHGAEIYNQRGFEK